MNWHFSTVEVRTAVLEISHFMKQYLSKEFKYKFYSLFWMTKEERNVIPLREVT